MSTGHRYIIEYHQVGGFMKVSAIDPITLTEVSIIADPKTNRKLLAQTAVRKLEWRMKKSSNPSA